MLRYFGSENLCQVLFQRGVDGARRVDITDGQVRTNLLRHEHVHAVVGLLADEDDSPEQEAFVGPQGRQDGRVPRL